MKLKNILKNKNENNSKYVYRVLKENIMNLYLAPGDPISETMVASFLHISRTPIREALIKLSEERLIKIVPQKTSTVTKLDIKLIKESVFMRVSLEKEVFSKALKEANFHTLLKDLDINIHFQKKILASNMKFHDLFYLDNEFHKLIFESIGMGRVWQSIMSFNTHHNRLRLLEVLIKKNAHIIIEQHEELIKLIEDRDYINFKIFIEKHLSNYKKTLNELKNIHPQYFLDH